MINWQLLRPMNFFTIGLIVLLVRFVLITAVNAIDGKNAPNAGPIPTTTGQIPGQ